MVMSVHWNFCRTLAALTVFYLATFAASAGAATSPHDECSAGANTSWTSGEKFAWQKICKNQTADFKDESDSQRTLSMGFLRAILSDPMYTKLISGRRVSISSAKLGGMQTSDGEIVNANIDELEFDNCLVENLQFTNGKMRSFVLRRGKVGILTFKTGSFSEISLSPEEASIIELYNVGIDSYLSIVGQSTDSGMPDLSENTEIDDVHLFGVHVRRFEIANGTIIRRLKIEDSIVDEALAAGGISADSRNANIESADIRSVKINGLLRLSSSNMSQLEIIDTDSNRVSLPSKIPASINLKSFRFSSWLNDLPTTVDYIKCNYNDRKGGCAYDPGVLDKIALSFRQEGKYDAARYIQYLKANDEYKSSTGVQRIYLSIFWAIVGYGFYPEIGFIWIGMLVIIGFFVFRTGQLTSGVVPRSWLVYSVDTVVPVIRLDSKHDDIQFAGRRQYFVYTMRILSAGLAYLVFKFLQNAVTGG